MPVSTDANANNNIHVDGNIKNNAPKLGCMKDKIWMSDDFDEPLEDFEEYM